MVQSSVSWPAPLVRSRMTPLAAQSGHAEADRRMSALRGEADIA